MANYYREDTALIQVSVGNTAVQGAQFAAIDGGHAEAATELIRPGNMEPAVAIGGFVTPADVTAEIVYSDQTAGWVQELYKQCGKSEVTAHVIPLDGDSNPNPAGKITWVGILKTVTVPKRDAYSSTKAMLQIAFTPNEGITT